MVEVAEVPRARYNWSNHNHRSDKTARLAASSSSSVTTSVFDNVTATAYAGPRERPGFRQMTFV
jgi:hypothetical protein